MNFVFGGQSIAPGQCRLGLPNFINPWTKPTPAPFTSTLACQKASFSVPPVPTFSSGCTSTPYAPGSYLWNFGEPASGVANSSTLSSPVHTYSTTGTYSVSLILYGNCTNDTLRQTLTISTPGPTPSVAGSFTICKLTKGTYTASGGSSYAWSNNSSGPTVTLSPTVTTVYTATVTLNGCSATRPFTVTVDPCTGLENFIADDGFAVFPNPVKDLLHVTVNQPSVIQLRDVTGTVRMEAVIRGGENELRIPDLASGVYFISVKSGEAIRQGRLVKME